MKMAARQTLKGLWRSPSLGEDYSLRDHYRALRGVVRHITQVTSKRTAAPKLASKVGEPRQWGTCKWCGLPISESRRLWHFACSSLYYAFWGNPPGRRAIQPGPEVEIPTPYGHTARRQVCPACGKAGLVHFELDHIMAIGVARRLGLHFYRRAYMPENLWWICEPCHKLKTAFDRALMRSLDTPVTAAEEVQPPMPPAPLFDWQETTNEPD